MFHYYSNFIHFISEMNKRQNYVEESKIMTISLFPLCHKIEFRIHFQGIFHYNLFHCVHVIAIFLLPTSFFFFFEGQP